MSTEQATYERERHALAHLMFGGEEPATGELDAAWGRTVRALRAWEDARIRDMNMNMNISPPYGNMPEVLSVPQVDTQEGP
jgi:hypothetical protein